MSGWCAVHHGARIGLEFEAWSRWHRRCCTAATLDSLTLPSHVRVIANDDVFLEHDALDQLARVASLPGCLRAVGMPDLHAGRGVPIGAAFRFDGVVRPSLVGTDAGCGVLLVATLVEGPTGDVLERRVRAALDEADEQTTREVGACDVALHRAAFASGARALVDGQGGQVPRTLAELADRALGAGVSGASGAYGADEQGDGARPSGACPGDELLARSLGSVGGGNHFAEIVRVDRLIDPARAQRLGLVRGRLAVLVHTGSRGLGAVIAANATSARAPGAARDGEVTLDGLTGEARARYLADLRGATRWARVNRLVVAHRLLVALGAARASKIAGVVDLVHNTVVEEPGGTFLHRKGAAPANAGAPTIVLGSRGAPSYVLEGRGDDACLCCVAHGAGRRMARGEAYDKLRARYTRASLARTKLGGRVICDDTVLMYEEHPDAYKPIEPVVESLVAAGAAHAVATLVPLVTVKR